MLHLIVCFGGSAFQFQSGESDLDYPESDHIYISFGMVGSGIIAYVPSRTILCSTFPVILISRAPTSWRREGPRRCPAEDCHALRADGVAMCCQAKLGSATVVVFVVDERVASHVVRRKNDARRTWRGMNGRRRYDSRRYGGERAGDGTHTHHTQESV